MKNTVINTRYLFYLFLFAVAMSLGLRSYHEDPVISVIMVFLSSLLMAGYVLFFPCAWVINEDGISVFYGPLVRISERWHSITCIEEVYAKGSLLIWGKDYNVRYFNTRMPFWQSTYIPKNRKTKRLLKKYYGRTIEK